MTRDGPPPRPGKPPKLRNSPLQRTKVCFPSVLHIVVHLCGQIVSTLSFICAGLRGLGDRPGASRLKRNRKPKARKPESPKSNTSVLKLCGAHSVLNLCGAHSVLKLCGANCLHIVVHLCGLARARRSPGRLATKKKQKAQSAEARKPKKQHFSR